MKMYHAYSHSDEHGEKPTNCDKLRYPSSNECKLRTYNCISVKQLNAFYLSLLDSQGTLLTCRLNFGLVIMVTQVSTFKPGNCDKLRLFTLRWGP